MDSKDLTVLGFEGQSVRMVIRNGEPWWVAKDIAEILEYKWAGSGTINHVPEKWKGVDSVPTPSGKQSMALLSEHGLYFFLARSDKPKALPFQEWIAGEVIPSIRKTGKYEITNQARKESIAARNALTESWQKHGADKFYHYINLTKSEYLALFGTKDRKKAEMNTEEIAALRLFEALENMKLLVRDDIKGYDALTGSIGDTGKLLDNIKTKLID